MPSRHNNGRQRVTSLDSSADERTLREPTSDGEDYDGRPSGEILDGDHDILDSEDEREKLLTRQNGISGMFSRTGTGVKIGKRNKRRGRVGDQESSALMYDMEEGAGRSSSTLGSRGGMDRDNEKVPITRLVNKTRAPRICRRICIYLSISVLFIVLLGATYRLSATKGRHVRQLMVSNGTSLFAPTTILISLDGFRADFLYQGLTPTLNQLVQEGISPKYMHPSFPSTTFPNHYTIATGLYPEAHGIVGNTFWDPKLGKDFYYKDSKRSLQSHWWGGEPLWVTAEKQQRRVAVHMWPGSEAHVLHQKIAYVDKYNGSEILPKKFDRIMGLLDLPGPDEIGADVNKPRPQLIAAYVPDVDSDGHEYGPNSTEIRKAIASADSMMARILQGLRERNLTNIVNVVVVSDHGMATTDSSRLVQFEDIIDPAELSHIEGWPHYGLRPKNPNDLHRLYEQAKERLKDNPNMEVYLRDENMPERYHFSKNERIAPLWIIPKAGWAVVTKDEYNVKEGQAKGEVYHPKGIHGYDHEHPLMRAIFIARGPAFPHRPGSRMDPFQNIEIYNIICDSIGITPAPNNGTLRLPLKPVGHHSDPDSPSDGASADPGFHTTTSSVLSLATMSVIFGSLSSIATSASGLYGLEPSLDDIPTRPTPPTIVSATPPAETSKAPLSWWEWAGDKANEVTEWVDDLFHKHIPSKPSGKNETAAS